MEEDGAQFPSNYVTIHQLKQRWLQQQSDPKPVIIDNVSDSDDKFPNPTIPPTNQLTPTKPRKIPSEPEHVDDQKQRGYRRGIPRPKPVKQQTRNQKPIYKTQPNDDAVSVDPAPVKQAGRRNRNRKTKHKTRTPLLPSPNDDDVDDAVTEDVAVSAPINEQVQPEHQSRNQNPKHKTKTTAFAAKNDVAVVAEDVEVSAPVKEQPQVGYQSSNQKLKHKTKTAPFTPKNDVSVVAEDVAIAAPVKEVGYQSRNNKLCRPKTPPFYAAGNHDDGSGVVEVRAVAVSAPVKLQHQEGRWTRNRKVFRPKTPPVDANDDDGFVVTEAVAVSESVKEINLCNVRHTRGGSERFQGGPEQRTWSRANWYSKPPFGRKKTQMSHVWVKKGESAPN